MFTDHPSSLFEKYQSDCDRQFRNAFGFPEQN
ncbi:hypothetical protein MgSA37_00765 [Mucilaginibacter gotjawali]|uniref:Uncharacterized protein n=2 Tax=Mucilaginibacter gotjawali TaxID=1550579 RepID=A0A110B0Q4_9SPHI|nr:hypothetical protein [Mucilaginibacter gotjawali]BAU52603.1 hypothetical protein MgSA37_00765 [Mucilaginibacter gotjawali]